jgi:NADPH:quinone reductase-like Zn-dependent oxidoreductase
MKAAVIHEYGGPEVLRYEDYPDHPGVRTVAFVSKQDTKNLEYMVEAVKAGKLTIPIASRVPLRNAAGAHAAFAKGSAGKILLLP